MELDLRSLGLFRIALAGVVLYDLFDRSRDLWALHGEQGLIPSAALGPGAWTLHALSSDPTWLIGLFLVHALVALALLIGWKTRVMGPLCWLLTLSLQQRNPYVLYGADQLLILCLLWGSFLPWGARFSVEPRACPNGLRSWAGSVLMGQLAVVYLVTAFLKNGPQWMRDGTGVYHALTTVQYEQPVGRWLRHLLMEHPILDQLLSFATLGWEYLVPILLFTPLRDLAAASMLLFHLCIAHTLMVGFFPFVSSALALAAFSGRIWDRWFPTRFQGGQEPVGVEPRWKKAVLLALVLLSTTNVVQVVSGWQPSQPLTNLVARLRLGQRWNMFAPGSPVQHGWYSARGTTVDGQVFEMMVLGREGYSQEKPDHVPSSLGGMRWNMFCFSFFPARRQRQKLSPLLINYLQRRWEQQHPGLSLARVELIYHQAKVVPYLDFPFEEQVIFQQKVYL